MSGKWSGGSFEVSFLDEADGFVSLLVEGENLAFLKAEAGGHRWQRIPPTEKKGRVHTSTVTVAVLDATDEAAGGLNPAEVKVTTTRGSGPGGQHRNKVETCVTATHEPTGLSVRIDGRSQTANRRMAFAILAAKLQDLRASSRAQRENLDRKDQVGSGMRGDKVRTYRVRDDQMVDHRTGMKTRLSSWLRGEVA
jgi:peptide chain release factor 1